MKQPCPADSSPEPGRKLSPPVHPEEQPAWRPVGRTRGPHSGADSPQTAEVTVPARRRRDTRAVAEFRVSTATIDPVPDSVTGQVWYQSSEEDTAVNVSRRGLCVLCARPPEVGTRLLVQVHLASQPRAIDMVGRACWTRVEFEPGEQGARTRCVVGIEILGGSPSALDRYDRAVTSLVETEGRLVATPDRLG